MQIITNESNSTTTVITSNGQATIPTNLYQLFSACVETPLVSLVAQAQALGYTNGYVRAQVQVLAQPGQYKGSPCIGALSTSTRGKRVLLTWGVQSAARPKLTRTGSDTPAAQALATAG